MRTLTLLLILVCSILSLQAKAQFGNLSPKEILLVIGYSDENKLTSLKDIFRHEYMYDLGQLVELRVTEQLTLMNFTAVENNKFVFENKKTKTRVTLLNSNFLCPNENTKLSLRTQICQSQILRSATVMDYVTKNLNNFDEFIYIGHSRLGLGLGFGPFNENYTFKELAFFNQAEAGRLKKVMIASCNSEKYYKNKVVASADIQFIGTNKDMDWIDELLPMVLNEIKNL